MRIVSLLPSTTEILFAIGAGEDVVGVTFECDHPPAARERRIVSTSALTPGLTVAEIDAEVRTRLGAGEDLYRLDEGALRDLNPDLVVTQDLCEVCAVDVGTVDAAMEHLGCDGQVLTIDPATLDDVLDSMVAIGAATGHEAAATVLVADLRERLDQIEAAVAGRARPRVAVLEWTDPPFGPGHWVPDLIVAAGGTPAIGATGGRSVPVEWADVAASRPDLVVVAPCGYHLDDAAVLAKGLLAGGRLPPDVPVWAVDADSSFVRPGPRLVDGVEALAAICHPVAVTPRPDVATYVGRGVSTT
ncbi:MAG: iron complex transport system substrate-binding protein [Actinomycetota bacterium]|nr:iron complex transport system substrate-binding protein [Actinomycetota bacterium]